MAYPNGTILTRVEPKRITVPQLQGAEYDQDSNTMLGGEYVDVEQDDPLNVIRVLGPSPVSKTDVASWNGGAGDHYVVTPQEEFGANQIAPESVLNSEYEITSLPDDDTRQKIHLEPQRERLQQGKSPEQIFQAQARDAQQAAAKRGPGRPKKNEPQDA